METEKLYTLKILQDSLIELVEYANSLESHEGKQSIQNLARLQVSVSFLNDVVERGEMITAEKIEFILLTKKFLYDKINDPELERFDTLIFEREGRSLLSIGNEFIYKIYIEQQSELEGKSKEKLKPLERIMKELILIQRNIQSKKDGWEIDQSKIAPLEKIISEVCELFLKLIRKR